jgi:hypothetical protein
MSVASSIRGSTSPNLLLMITPHCTVFSGSTDVIEASELETFISLPDIPTRHYCLQRPMNILIQRDDCGFTVSQPDTAVFSYDADVGKALDLFYGALISQYEFLKANKRNLSSSLQRDLETFDSFLKPC